MRRSTTTAVSVLALLAALAPAGCGAEPDAPPSTSPSSEASGTPDPSGSSEPVPPRTTTQEAPVDATSAIFPLAADETRFTSPEAAATAFATEYVGLTAPLVGGFQSADARSGEVEVRTRPGGPPSTVVVRLLADNTWWVLGSGMADIRLDQPAAGTRITSPVRLTGAALAYEGHVDVELRADGVAEPIATGFVTGGGDEMRPFEGSLAFTAPAASHGALLLITRSALDGSVADFVAVRVAF